MNNFNSDWNFKIILRKKFDFKICYVKIIYVDFFINIVINTKWRCLFKKNKILLPSGGSSKEELIPNRFQSLIP